MDRVGAQRSVQERERHHLDHGGGLTTFKIGIEPLPLAKMGVAGHPYTYYLFIYLIEK
jgi:hypothetical protein